MSVSKIGRLRDDLAAREIVFRLGISAEDVTPDYRWNLAVGNLDEGASEHWPRWPYRFPWPPAETDWPRPLPTLLTEGYEDE